MLPGDRITPLEMAYASKAQIVCEFGEYAGAKLNGKKALQLINKEFETHPVSTKNIKLQSLHLGLSVVNKMTSEIKEHEQIVNSILTKKNPTEDELSYVIKYKQRVEKDKEGAEKIKKQIIESYPNNYYAYTKVSGEMRGAKSISEKIAVLEKWDKSYVNRKSINSTRNYLISKIARHYADEEDWVHFKKYLNMMDNPDRRAGLLNRSAWLMSGESIEGEAKDSKMGQQFSKESLEILKVEMKDMAFRPKVFTERQYLRRLKYSYAMNSDTYALLAYKNGDLNEALNYQLIACENNKFSNGEMNERYCTYFEKLKGSGAAEDMIAGLIGNGKASSKMKAQYKRLFLENNTAESAYDKYIITQLEKSADELMKGELKKQMLDTPAPKFDLLNLKGETVNSDDLRGKVIVVDFWATWCGPCKASFPGMQKAVKKFENSEDVAFVFIDTWESGDNVTGKVSDFITSNNYTFNVLMDTDASTVSSFGVTGIPAKFIIDKKGMIKFRSSGFSGNDEELVNELTMMIELAGGNEGLVNEGTP